MGIRFIDVSHAYRSIDGKKMVMAIKDINLTIDEKKEFIAICGQTGSGKTTLVQHMNALLLPTKGEVQIFDKTIKPKRNKKVNSVRKRVGLVFQFPEYQLFEETVLKDIMFGPLNFGCSKKEAMEKARKAAGILGITKYLSKSPFRLSGGQMRRVAIAGILAMDPDILVLDEPTRGLDPKGTKETMELFMRIHEKYQKTIVIITHDMDLVGQYMKRVIVFKDGEKVFDGKKEELFCSENFSTFHLDYPLTMKAALKLKEELHLDINPNVFTIEDLIKELERV